MQFTRSDGFLYELPGAVRSANTISQFSDFCKEMIAILRIGSWFYAQDRHQCILLLLVVPDRDYRTCVLKHVQFSVAFLIADDVQLQKFSDIYVLRLYTMTDLHVAGIS